MIKKQLGLLWLSLALLSSGASAHSLEPSYRIIRFVNGMTTFPMTAVNGFDYSEEYHVEVWEDDSFSYRLDYYAVPESFTLGEYSRREFTITMDEVILDEFIVCTATDNAGGATRVCGRVYVCPARSSSTQCKRWVQHRRNSNLIRR